MSKYVCVMAPLIYFDQSNRENPQESKPHSKWHMLINNFEKKSYNVNTYDRIK